ncbi:uncharacterized protein J4E84_005458 [Alternaria hordeiaustralica]|uniref:uncharacterized protein n=1 Tax=Alternaria hordeiaustralica TaxID=1187925 RepID=UPI0020C570D2|nr:uncharacterized protein J4E84_005458 [Alternaria hordeiaustralica]KAI4687087.1 hypothetical protein J4E84_005458 [Alternaria hordeiaustralica]
MLRTMHFTSLPLLAAAAYLDPSLQQQKPLLDSKPASSDVVTLILDQNLHYIITTSSDYVWPTRLDHLQAPVAAFSIKESIHHAITINIPSDSSLTGTATFFTTPQPELWSQSTDQFTWTPHLLLNSGKMLGAHIPILDIGIRKDGMLTMPAKFATLDLSTPYIYVPKGIWDVLLLATTTEQQARDGEEVLYVDCGALSVFPDLVFGMAPSECGSGEEIADDDDDGEDDYDEEEEDYGELVITPEQYVLQTSEGKCMLLTRNADSHPSVLGTVSLGWAAVRGREVILDRHVGRIGFGSSV